MMHVCGKSFYKITCGLRIPAGWKGPLQANWSDPLLKERPAKIRLVNTLSCDF